MEILSHKIVKAQKDHKCSFCGQVIEKGNSYEISKIVRDGIYTWKSHIHCDKLAEKLDMYKQAREDNGEGVDKEYFIESVNVEFERLFEKNNPEAYNHPDYDPPSWPGRLKYVLGEHNLIVK